MNEPPRPSSWFPVIVLAVAVVLALVAWQVFPVIQGFVARQDCVATGRTNC